MGSLFGSIWRIVWRFFKLVLLFSVLLVLAAIAFVYFAPTFGSNPSGESLQRVQASDNYSEGKFVNLVETAVDTRAPGEPLDLATYFFPQVGKNPDKPIKTEKFNSASIKTNQFVWFGHSTVLFKTGDLTVLTDPTFHRASPVSWVGQAFDYVNDYGVKDLPEIDVVLISHDHYDHLDHLAIGQLASRVDRFLIPLGLQGHLLRWGVAEDKITELDWYDLETVGGVEFTLTPSRHFSGRGITNRFTTLWGSWAVKSAASNVFFSGDSGYFDEFSSIGERLGPFDIAFIENGAYSEHWAQIHMMPEQAAQAALDLDAAIFFPIHWGKFDLSTHQWLDPVRRARVAAESLDVTMASPRIGQVFDLTDIPQEIWWEDEVLPALK